METQNPLGDSRKREGKTAMTVSKLRQNKGFTLVEIMVAIAILSIALLGLISVTVTVIKGNTFSKTMTKATTWADDKMEKLKSKTYSDPGLVSGTDTPESSFTRTWTVTSDSPAAGMKTISVTVQWDWQGTTRNVTVRNIIAQ